MAFHGLSKSPFSSPQPPDSATVVDFASESPIARDGVGALYEEKLGLVITRSLFKTRSREGFRKFFYPPAQALLIEQLLVSNSR